MVHVVFTEFLRPWKLDGRCWGLKQFLIHPARGSFEEKKHMNTIEEAVCMLAPFEMSNPESEYQLNKSSAVKHNISDL